MKRNKFDVLPIKNPNGTFTEFFATRTWNDYNSLNRLRIDDNYKAYYRLGINDLIHKFINEQTHYYFLTNYNEILGLVTLINFNSQPVYNYFFQLVSDMEIRLARVFNEYINQDKIVKLFEWSENPEITDLLKKFKKWENEGNDNSIFHHFYLKTFGYVFIKYQTLLPSGLKPILKFREKFCAGNLYTNIRNTVMHPVKPIIGGDITLDNLAEFLSDYKDITQILENFEQEENSKAIS